MTHRSLFIILAGSLLVAAGCGGSDKPATSTTQKPAAATVAAKRSRAPYGTYVRRVTKHDLSRTARLRDEAGPNQDTPALGRYRLVIARGAAQDVLKATDPTDFTVAMDVAAAGAALDLTSYVNPGQGAFCGPEVAAQARYAFQVDGARLVLKPRRPDACADRDAILTGSWTKG